VPTSKGAPKNRIFAMFTDYPQEVQIFTRSDFLPLSILKFKTQLDFLREDVNIRPACLPKAISQTKEKCSPNYNEEFVFCRNEVCDQE
jgi:hypothetical protein